MQLTLQDNAHAFHIVKLREAVTLCQYAGKPGRITDEEETIATVDMFGVIRDLDDMRVELTENADA